MTVMTKIRFPGENSRDFTTANSSENMNKKTKNIYKIKCETILFCEIN